MLKYLRISLYYYMNCQFISLNQIFLSLSCLLTLFTASEFIFYLINSFALFSQHDDSILLIADVILSDFI